MILFILMCLVVFMAGYLGTGVLMDLNQQRVMNSMRNEIGLPTKPYAIRRNN